MQKALWAGIGLGLGLILGIFIGARFQGGASADTPPPDRQGSVADGAPPKGAMPPPKDNDDIPPSKGPMPPSEADARSAARPASAPIGAPPPEIASEKKLVEENAKLREQLSRLQGDLKGAQDKDKEQNGEPIPMPANLDPRFAQQAVFDAAQNALKEAGFDKAQITSIDCTEYPCIVYGDGMGSREDFQKLEQTDALGAYKADNEHGMGWRSGSENGPARFGLAIFPKDPSQDQSAIGKRIQYRAQQMMDSGN